MIMILSKELDNCLITEGCLWYLHIPYPNGTSTYNKRLGYNSNNHELMLINIVRKTNTHIFLTGSDTHFSKKSYTTPFNEKNKELWSIKVYNSHNRTIVGRQLNVSAIPLNSNKLEPKNDCQLTTFANHLLKFETPNGFRWNQRFSAALSVSSILVQVALWASPSWSFWPGNGCTACSLPETNMFATENGWLENKPFLLGPSAYFPPTYWRLTIS